MSLTDTVARHGVGANKPPLTELLSSSYEQLLADADALLASADRAPEKIDDDDTVGKVGRLVVKIREIRTKAQAAHKMEKEPHLTAGRQVDTFFGAIVTRAETAIKTLERRQSLYVTAKEEVARRAQREAEDRAREEAEAKLRAAQHAEDHGDMEAASKALTEAATAEATAEIAGKMAEAKPADLVRTYTTSGNVVSSQARWECEIINRAEIPLDVIRAYIPQDAIEKAVRAFVRAGGRELKGVRIFEDRKVVNR